MSQILFKLLVISNFMMLILPLNLTAQQNSNSAYGEILLVNRLYETKTRAIRPDKPITVRLIDGRKISGEFYLEDEQMMIIGSEKIRMDSIYSLTGFVIRNSIEKAIGTGLTIFSVAGIIYPLYLIAGGFGLGEGKALFVGITLLFVDSLLAYAGTSLAGICPRRFNMMNWGIRITHQSQLLLPIPIEIPLDMDP